MDYGMLLARKFKPAVVVVGSYDDVVERNAWLIADTSEATPPERQMRDFTGAISLEAFYNRVKEWITEGTPAVVAGGMLPDGAYMIGPQGSTLKDMLMMDSSQSLFLPLVGAALVTAAATSSRRDILHWYTSCKQCGRHVCSPACEPNCCTPVSNATQRYFAGATLDQMGCDAAVVPTNSSLVCSAGKIFGVQNGTAPLFWLSHAGNDSYRIFAVNTGLVLTQQGGAASMVTQEWPVAASAAQLWRLERAAANSLRVSGSSPDLQWQLSQGRVVLGPVGGQWSFGPVATL